MKNASSMPVTDSRSVLSHVILTPHQVNFSVLSQTKTTEAQRSDLLKATQLVNDRVFLLFEQTPKPLALLATCSFFKSSQIKVSLFWCRFEVWLSFMEMSDYDSSSAPPKCDISAELTFHWKEHYHSARLFGAVFLESRQSQAHPKGTAIELLFLFLIAVNAICR